MPRAACPALGIEIKKSGSAMTSAISQLVYMPNFRAIGKSVWEKNGNRQTDRNTERQTHLNFIKILAESTCYSRLQKKEWGSDKKRYVIFEWPLKGEPCPKQLFFDI